MDGCTENGERLIRFIFDIDWLPIKQIANSVLPILEDQYGQVLRTRSYASPTKMGPFTQVF
jgi:hypothetical protein